VTARLCRPGAGYAKRVGYGGRFSTRAALTAVAVALLAGGCGGSDEPGPGAATNAAPATTPAATTESTPAAPATGSGDANDAGPLKRYEVMGVSALLPSNWKGEPDETGVIVGPPGKDAKGAAALIIFEDDRTADEWIDKIALSGYPKGTKVVSRKHIRVPTLGRGVHLVLQRPKSPPDHFVYVSTIDGLIVEVTASPGPHLTKAQSRRILASPRRVR
jgi:hypothetical protein